MPRSPLLQSIVQLARRCGLARKLGVPVEALDEREARMRERRTRDGGGLSRRRFLMGAAAVLALPRWASAYSRANAPRIAIIGAGISGLNCALTLADNGISSTVYEASPRVGGRMFSNNSGYWAENQITEWCGELIDTEHTAIQALAARFGLALDDALAAQPAGSSETYFFKGGYYSRAEAVADFQPVYTAVQADAANLALPNGDLTDHGISLDRMSLFQWIQSRVPDGHDSRIGRLLDVAYANEYGADTRGQNALNLVYQLSGSDRNFEILGTSDERYRIRGGNELLPAAVAAYLQDHGAAIETSTRLSALRLLSDGTYRLSFDSAAGPSEIQADYVVLALPFAVLRSLDCGRAGFDALKRKAIHDLGGGQNGKLQLQFGSRLWNSDGPWGTSTGTTYADIGYQNTWEPTRAQAGTSGVLNNYTSGRVTRKMRSKRPFANATDPDVDRDATAFLAQIERVFPGVSPLWNGRATSSLPHRSPYFRCSYSYYKIGQINTISGYEGVPQGNVFFAGEHTSDQFQGYMEGAVREGERAGREVLAKV